MKTQTPAERIVSGRSVVVVMFAFGLTATAILFLYWNLHLMPFMPLQKAIAAEFENSSPRVEGGQRKMRLSTPRILRVTMRIAFDPVPDDDLTTSRLADHMQRLRVLADRHLKLAEYNVFEANFYQPVEEQELRRRTVRLDLQTWQEVDESGQPLKTSATKFGSTPTG